MRIVVSNDVIIITFICSKGAGLSRLHTQSSYSNGDISRPLLIDEFAEYVKSKKNIEDFFDDEFQVHVYT